MLLDFGVAPLICWLTGEPRGLSDGLLLMFVLIVARRLTAGVSLDLSVGAKVAPMLLRRLLFDESLTGRG